MVEIMQLKNEKILYFQPREDWTLFPGIPIYSKNSETQ
jgi:hypothetical protein